MPSEKQLLEQAARLFNIQSAHYDGFGHRVEPPPEAIVKVLRMLGAAIEKLDDLAGAIRERRQLLWRREVPAVVTTWGGNQPHIKVRIRQPHGDRPIRYRIELEDGGTIAGKCREHEHHRAVARTIEGITYVARSLVIPERPATGYHTLQLTIENLDIATELFVAPFRAYDESPEPRRDWGLFCPVYALGSETNWGVGDISDLESLLEFASDLGARAVGTLPLLAAFLDEPFNPSPYAPVSRLFWNELFLDISRIPELAACASAQTEMNSAAFRAEVERLRAAPHVEYRRAMMLKRGILERLLGCLLESDSSRRAEFDSFVQAHAGSQDYASFRAKVERERNTWENWRGAQRAGKLEAGDYDEAARQYHLYVQWLAEEQLGRLGGNKRAGGSMLYLDFPVGVNRDGYDVWRERDAFALEASGGAPPDGFFTGGQNWGFPPLHPEGLRSQGYRYYIACLRHHLRHAKMLRIDHVMGLHRSYWVPAGFSAKEGVYVRYPAEEFYAVLNLESHRHQAQIIGENLGTVPPHINLALEQHGVRGMYVAQFGVRPDPRAAVETPPRRVVASLNTHDTPTFAGFLSGADIDDRLALGLMSQAGSVSEHAGRSAQRHALAAYLLGSDDSSSTDAVPQTVLQAWLAFLARSDVELLLVNLEDLWLEAAPQNVPGTWDERPNWMRKASHSLDEIRRIPELLNLLRAIDAIRNNTR
jgi:4-alpha-glucanotransferase